MGRYQKGKTNLGLLKQETVSGSGISWAICKSASRSRQITTPAPHHSVFLQAGCPSCRPTNSVKALKVEKLHEVQNSKTVLLTLTTPLSGNIFHRQGGTCYGKSLYQIGSLRFACYEAMNGGAKVNLGGLGRLGVTQGHGQCRHSIEHIRLPIRL